MGEVLFATGSYDRTAKVWRRDTWECLHVLAMHQVRGDGWKRTKYTVFKNTYCINAFSGLRLGPEAQGRLQV